MMLYLTSIDHKSQDREFYCQLDTLEVAFDFLSDIVAKGSTLSQAYILDDGQRTDLPIAVFDGEPFLAAMQELEKDWQSLLTVPATLSLANGDELILLIQQRVKQFEMKIANYQKMIDRLEHLLQRTQKNFSSGPLKSKVISQYESMISRNRVWLIKAEISHKIILIRLSQLSG